MPVIEFRVALTVDDFNRAVAFYRDGLGLDPGEIWTDNGNGQIFSAGRATLEIFDDAHASAVDQLEVGARLSGQIRFAFEVTDVHAAVARAQDYGAVLVHPPTLTPWNHLNARLQAPDGLQVTLFQVMA
ncbi:MAG: VOC family protein [Anaerolineae bacterium]|jgi:catechol 2,3-dioxygenase-like lactoylglutathione lyase family enzyme|nr:VOC family protein [Anaerolineae bacterium]